MRIFNVLLYPTPNSVLFWDMIVLNGYLFLNIVIGWNVLEAERNGVHSQSWLKPLIYLSIPWAVSIHTVTAFLYCGLPGRGFWLTAILAPRFLSSAFAAGPALLILLCLDHPPVHQLRSGPGADPVPGQDRHLRHLHQRVLPSVRGLRRLLQPDPRAHGPLQVPVRRAARPRGLRALDVDLDGADADRDHPAGQPHHAQKRRHPGRRLPVVFFGTWIDKGMGMISGGFVPNPLHEVNEYIPTLLEGLITLGVYALGFLVLTVLFKIAVSVKEEVRA